MPVFPQAAIRMRNFLYRSPRIETNLSMDFVMGDLVVLGACKSLSESGILGNLFHPVPAQSEGTLNLYCGDNTLKVNGVVEHTHSDEVRIRLSDTADRPRVREFMNLVSAATPPAS
jgi:hypothetical protein